MTLGEVLQKHLRLNPEAARQLVRQGSVWDGERKKRLKDETMAITGQLLRVDRPKFTIQEYELLPEEIKYEDHDLLIVFKRGGVPVQPTPYSDIDNLLHGVQKYYDCLSLRYRAAPINRLDLPAQGLVFFAKNKRSEIALHRQFQERKIRKRYLAATRVCRRAAFLYHPLGAGVAGKLQAGFDLRSLLPGKQRPLFFSGFSAERAHPPDPPPFSGKGGAPGR